MATAHPYLPLLSQKRWGSWSRSRTDEAGVGKQQGRDLGTQTMYRAWQLLPQVPPGPAVLRDEYINELFHGQVGDELFLGLGDVDDRVKVAPTLQVLLSVLVLGDVTGVLP